MPCNDFTLITVFGFVAQLKDTFETPSYSPQIFAFYTQRWRSPITGILQPCRCLHKKKQNSSPPAVSNCHCRARRIAYFLCLIYPNVMQILSCSNEKSLEKTHAHAVPLRRAESAVCASSAKLDRRRPSKLNSAPTTTHQTIPHRWIYLLLLKHTTNPGPECANPTILTTHARYVCAV